MSNEIAIANAKARTGTAVGIGDARGWGRPEDYTRLVAISVAAHAAIRESDPAPVPPPTTAEDVNAWVDATATARVHAAARRTAAEHLVLETDRQIALLGERIAGESIPRLVEEFAKQLKAYTALADAPRALSGHEDAKALTAHASLLRCASDLTDTLGARGTLALITGEAEDLGMDAIWLILAATPATSLDALTDAVARFRGSLPATPEDWDALVPLGLSLARLGEVSTRRQRHSDALYARGMGTPDGGMFDRTYGEAEQMAGTR